MTPALRAAAVALAALAAAPVAAATLPLAPTNDPLMTISGALVELDMVGELFVDGAIDSFVAGGVDLVAPLEFSFSTVTAELNVFEPGSVDDVLTGALVEFAFLDGALQVLFDTVGDSEGVFGGRILMILTSGDFAAGATGPLEVADVTGAITAPVPLPGALPLLAAGIAALGLIRRRAA